MVSKEKLDRINELARKNKAEGLTPEETAERDALRREYIDAVKASLSSQLDRIKFVDEVDEDVDIENWTPEQIENATYLSEKLGDELKEQNRKDEEFRTTVQGNPSHPTGEAGEKMLERMNDEHRTLTDWGLDFYNGPAPKTILDIGCGGGACIANLHERFPEAQIYGIDKSDISVEKTLETNRDLVVEDTVRVTQGDVSKLPYGDDFFDLIVSVSSYFFWDDFDSGVDQIKRVLKPGGTALIMSNTYKGYKLEPKEQYFIDNFTTNFFTPEELEKIFKDKGFSSVEVHVQEDPRQICVQAVK